MKFELGENYYGFTLKSAEDVKELQSKVYIFEHSINKARLLAIKNDDSNKTFGIGFRTPPPDPTGLPHIIEHSVLCGSRKYPLKSPFAELLRSSLQTFLNAMTFSDKTVYLVSSRNKKDYFNLMDVYLDSVLYPLLREDTFKQEGWHYELESEDEDPVYKGVVYNEMRGAYSSPESVVERNIELTLFPDTPYGNDSGGNPDKIPDLTYKQFKDFHAKYYHPSNSYLYLYGNAPLEEELSYIQSHFLKDFQEREVDSHIPMQKPFTKAREFEYSYPIAEGEPIESKSFLSLASVIGDNHNRELQLAFTILRHILIGTPAAPLKKELLKANISQDIKGEHSDYSLQPYFYVTLLNTEAEHKEKFLNVYHETLTDLVNNGIDKDLLRAAFNNTEFNLRQLNSNTMRGIHYLVIGLNTWLYDDSPLSALMYEDILKDLKGKAKGGFFEKLIDKYLLKNTHQALLLVKPDPEMAKRKREEQSKKLHAVKSSMTPAEIEALITDTLELKNKQATTEAKENIDKLPKLSLSDIPGELERIPIMEEKVNGVTLLTHDIFTQKIIYLDLMFNMNSLPDKYIPYLNLFGDAITGMGTKDKDYTEFAKEIAIYTGNLQTSQQLIARKDDHHRYFPMMLIHGEALPHNWDKMLDIYIDVIKNIYFADEKRLHELVLMGKARLESMIQEQAINFVNIRLQAYESEAGKFSEQMGGISACYFMRDLADNFAAKKGEIISTLEEMRKILFNKSNLLINLTADKESLKMAKPGLSKILDVINDEKFKEVERHLPTMPVNQGLKTSSKVQYTGVGANMFDIGMPYNGAFEVCNNLLGTLYLWNNIRVMGGAYGCMNRFNNLDGHYCIISYRDPNLDTTYKIYHRIPEMLKTLSLSKEELTKIIISTIGRIDKPLDPYPKGLRSAIDYLSGRTYEDRALTRSEVINTGLEDLKALAPYFKALLNKGYRCTLGNEQKIELEDQWFDEKIPVF